MKIKKIIVYLVIVILLLLLWEQQAASSKQTRLLISSPSLIANYLNDNFPALWLSFWTTFKEAFLGLVIATAFCFAITILCIYLPSLLDYLLPVMVTSQVIPLITLAPLFIILFGDGITAKIMMSALLCFFPIFINMAHGIRSIDKNIHELLFVYNASRWHQIRYVYFTVTMPHMMAGLKIASTLATIGAIVGEFNGAQVGLGKNLFISAKRLEPDLMMTSLFLSALLGALMYAMILFIEHRFGKWYLQNRRPNGLQ